MLKSMTCLTAIFSVATAVAATVSTNGSGMVTIDVSTAGETYVYPDALSSVVSAVRKTGAGTVQFATAANNFSGTIAIEGGYADFAALNAYGTAAIDVSDGAAMIVSHASPGQLVVAVQGTITIAGSGPDGNGALRFTGTGGAHKLYNKIVLSGNATMGGKKVGAKEIDMQNDYELTWKGPELMSRGCTWSNFGGLVYNGTAEFIFQDTSMFDASCSSKQIKLNSGGISFVGSEVPVPFQLQVNVNATISADGGGGLSKNTWSGPITVASGKTLTLRTVEPTHTLRVSGAISGPGKVVWTRATWGSGAGSIYLDNASSDWTGGLSASDACSIYALSKGAIGNFGTVGVPAIVPGNSTTECTLYANVGAPLTGANVQTSWSAEDVRELMANALLKGTYASIGLHVPAGASFTYPYNVTTNMSKAGSGTLEVTGLLKNSASKASCVILREGTLVWNAPGDSLAYGLEAKGPGKTGVFRMKAGTIKVQDSYMYVGNSGRFALWQEGGVINKTSWTDTVLGGASGSYGAWVMDDGTARLFYPLVVASSSGSFGVLVQKGGTFAKWRNGIANYNHTFNLGVRGDAVMYVAGGTNNSYYAASPGSTASFQVGSGIGGTATLTVSGTNTLLKTDILVLGANDSARTNVFNISDGGTFEANRFYAGCYNADGEYYPYSNGCFNVVNIDGGIMRPTLEDAWNHVGSSCPARDPEKFILFGRGLTVDTEACSYAHQFPFHIDPATGSGFDAIYLPTNDTAFMAQTYFGPARVRIADASGWGATAFADFDKTTGKLTGVIVTSRGCDYSASPSVTVDSADGSRTYSCTFVLSQNVCGGLTKRGAAAMHLYGTNTYSGVTCVESGTLRPMHAKAIPANSHCRVKNGATLQLPGAMSISSVGGSGTIIGGAVTLTGGIIAHSEDLNVRRGLVVEGGVTFTDGAKVRIADFAALDAAQTGMPLITASSAIVGTPEIDRDSIPEPYGIRFTGDRRTLKLCNLRGIRIIFR